MVHGVKPGDHVGVVGLGGLGQMGARIAKAMGCTVSTPSTPGEYCDEPPETLRRISAGFRRDFERREPLGSAAAPLVGTLRADHSMGTLWVLRVSHE